MQEESPSHLPIFRKNNYTAHGYIFVDYMATTIFQENLLDMYLGNTL
jgi:hypothetical protein